MSPEPRGGIKILGGYAMVQFEDTPGAGPPAAWDLALHAFRMTEFTMNPGANASTYERGGTQAGPTFNGHETPVPGMISGTWSARIELAASGDATTGASLRPQFEPLFISTGWGVVESDAPSKRTYSTRVEGHDGTVDRPTIALAAYKGPAQDVSVGAVPNNWLLYQMFGAKGTWAFEYGGEGEPLILTMEGEGTYVPKEDVSAPGSPTLQNVKPRPFLTTNITWTPGGGSAHTPRIREFGMTGARNIIKRTDTNESSGTGVVAFCGGRARPSAALTIEEELLSGNDYDTDYRSEISGALDIGPVGPLGNRYTFKAPNAQLANMPQPDEADEISVLGLEYILAQDVSDLAAPAVQLTLE